MVGCHLSGQQSYTVRRACTADISAVMQIEAQSFDTGIAEDEAVFAERLAEAEGCNYVLVNAASQSVCGYFTAELWAAQQVDSSRAGDAPMLSTAGLDPAFFDLGHSVRDRHDPAGTTLYISSFALLPEVRGQRTADKTSGIAEYFFSAALDYITAAFPQLQRIILLVHEDWHKAITIYEGQGFTRIQVLDNFSWFAGKKAFIYEKRTPVLKVF